MNFRTKDCGNFAKNLPQSKEISATLGREVAPFIMSANFICPDSDEPCQLPIFPGKYSTGDNPTIIILPEIPDILADLFGGTYTMEMHIDLTDETEMTCIYMRVEIETNLM